MTFTHDHFTMSYRQACDYGIDYRDYEKVTCSPKGVPLTAVAGVWGDYVNIRCLFEGEDGTRYLRNIRRWEDKGYSIKELGVDAKDLWVGLIVEVL